MREYFIDFITSDGINSQHEKMVIILEEDEILSNELLIKKFQSKRNTTLKVYISDIKRI